VSGSCAGHSEPEIFFTGQEHRFTHGVILSECNHVVIVVALVKVTYTV
jgi:hypothetical protein